MTDYSTLVGVHSDLQAAIDMVVAPDFSANSAEGLKRRLTFVKGLLSAAHVITSMDPDYVDWDAVDTTLAGPFPGGGTAADRLTLVLGLAVTTAEENMMLATGTDKWQTAGAALGAVTRAMLALAAPNVTPSGPPPAPPPVVVGGGGGGGGGGAGAGLAAPSMHLSG